MAKTEQALWLDGMQNPLCENETSSVIYTSPFKRISSAAYTYIHIIYTSHIQNSKCKQAVDFAKKKSMKLCAQRKIIQLWYL